MSKDFSQKWAVGLRVSGGLVNLLALFINIQTGMWAVVPLNLFAINILWHCNKPLSGLLKDRTPAGRLMTVMFTPWVVSSRWRKYKVVQVPKLVELKALVEAQGGSWDRSYRLMPIEFLDTMIDVYKSKN